VGAPPDVLIRFAPALPTHVEVVTTVTAAISGPVQFRVSLPSRVAIDIARAAGDGYSLRVGIDGMALPYTVQLSRTAEVVRVTRDPGSVTAVALEADTAAFDPSALLGAGDETQGRWRVGDSRVVALRVPDGASGRVVAPTTVTLRRVGAFRGRAAALFGYAGTASVAVPGADTNLQMRIEGEMWRDLATGLTVHSKGAGTAPIALDGTAGTFHMEFTHEVDWAKSRL
jgi:hypothetical protein